MENRLVFDALDFTQIKSPESGVPIYFKSWPVARDWLELRVLLQVGALNDPAGKEGLAHFVEHILGGQDGFSETNVFRPRMRNAGTGHNMTFFLSRILKAGLDEEIDELKRIIFYPEFRQDILDRQGKVIQNEILKFYLNSELGEVKKVVQKDLYVAHPLSRMQSFFGWVDTVRGITYEDIQKFHKQHYHSGNLSVLLLGDIDQNEAGYIADCFGRGLAQCPCNKDPEKIKKHIRPNCPGSCFRTKIAYQWIKLFQIVPYLEVFEYFLLKMYLKILFDYLKQSLPHCCRKVLKADYELKEFCDHSLIEFELVLHPQIDFNFKEELCRLMDILSGSVELEDAFNRERTTTIWVAKNSDVKGKEIITEAIFSLSRNGRIVTLQEKIELLSRMKFSDLERVCKEYLKPACMYESILMPREVQK